MYLSTFPPLWRKGKTGKLARVLLFLCLLSASMAAHAQTVSLSVRNASLQEVFKEMEKQTGYVFFYDSKGIAGAHPVTLTVKGLPLRSALDSCLRGQPLEYSIINHTVVTRPKKAASVDQETASATGGAREIRGVVLDSSYAPLADATVLVKGRKIGTQTNSQGRFVLKETAIHDSDVVLEASFTGYSSQTKVVRKGDGNNNVILILKPSASQLDQIEVVAYGTATQRYSVGSVATVTSRDIELQPIDNPLQALQGRVAGLQITTTNGAPGAMVLAQIRGQNSLTSNLNPSGGVVLSSYDQPLYIIDGIPFAPQNGDLSNLLPSNLIVGSYTTTNPYNGISPLNSINPHDIESISVLKDADATAIYGSRGANGVIIITTKRARPGKMGLDVGGSSGPMVAARNVKMMSTRQYLQMRHEALANDGLTPSISPGHSDYDLLLMDTTRSIDYYHQLLGKTAEHTEGHVSLTGGTDNASYLVSGSYRRSNYNFPGNFYDQAFSFNNSVHIGSPNKRLSMTLSTIYSYDDNKGSQGVNTFGVISLPPDYPGFLDAKGNLLWSYKGVPLSAMAGLSGNPYAGLRKPAVLQNYNLNASANIAYKIIRGLSVGGTFGYSQFTSRTFSASPIAATDPSRHTLASASFGNGLQQAVDIEPQITYQRVFGKLKLDALVGGTYQKQSSNSLSVNGNNYPNDALLNTLAGAASITASSSALVTKYAAAFGRIGLIWDSRYILNLTGNDNGSSLFGPGYRWGQFGSVGAGWIFSETRLVRQALPWLSFGKVTANTGVTGSNSVSPYLYQPNWTISGVTNTYQGSVVYTAQNPYSPNFHWATKHDYNAHLSLGLFHDWIIIDGGVYRNYTSNQLLNTPLPSQTGFASVVGNAPYTDQNTGYEIAITPRISARPQNTDGFVWLAPNITISRNYNKITKVAANSPYTGILIKGRSGSTVPLLKFAGVDPATGIFQYYKADGKTKTFTPNAASAYLPTPGDASQLYDPTPSINIGLGDGFSWKGLTVNFFANYVKQRGRSYLNSVYGGYQAPGAASLNEPAAIVGKEWKKPGDKASLRLFSTLSSDGLFANSTGTLTDASYLQISNLSMNYRLPNSLVKRLRMQGGNVFLHVQNLLTISSYQVGDPTSQSIFNIPPQRVLNGGVSFNF